MSTECATCVNGRMGVKTLVLIRHGESTWNLENRFTGWTDVDLTETGIAQAKNAGQLLKSEGYDFDLAYTSVLKRATRTLWHTLDEMTAPGCRWCTAGGSTSGITA